MLFPVNDVNIARRWCMKDVKSIEISQSSSGEDPGSSLQLIVDHGID